MAAPVGTLQWQIEQNQKNPENADAHNAIISGGALQWFKDMARPAADAVGRFGAALPESSTAQMEKLRARMDGKDQPPASYQSPPNMTDVPGVGFNVTSPTPYNPKGDANTQFVSRLAQNSRPASYPIDQVKNQSTPIAIQEKQNHDPAAGAALPVPVATPNYTKGEMSYLGNPVAEKDLDKRTKSANEVASAMDKGFQFMTPPQGNSDDYNILGKSHTLEAAAQSDNPMIRSLVAAHQQGQAARAAALAQAGTPAAQGQFNPTYAPTDGMVFRGSSTNGGALPAPPPRYRQSGFDPAQFGTPDPINRDRTGGSYKTGRQTSIDPKTGQEWTRLMDSSPESIAAARNRSTGGGNPPLSRDEKLVNALANPFMSKIGSEFDIAKPGASTGQKEVVERMIPGKGWIAGIRDYDPNRPANEMRGSMSVIPGLTDEEKAKVAALEQRDAERQKQQEQLAFMEQTMNRLAPPPNMSGFEERQKALMSQLSADKDIRGFGKSRQRKDAIEAAQIGLAQLANEQQALNQAHGQRQQLASQVMQNQSEQARAEQAALSAQQKAMLEQQRWQTTEERNAQDSIANRNYQGAQLFQGTQANDLKRQELLRNSGRQNMESQIKLLDSARKYMMDSGQFTTNDKMGNPVIDPVKIATAAKAEDLNDQTAKTSGLKFDRANGSFVYIDENGTPHVGIDPLHIVASRLMPSM